MNKMLKLFEKARLVSVPIVVIRSADQEATIDAIRSVSGEFPLVQYDAARGMTSAQNTSQAKDFGQQALKGAGFSGEEGFAEALEKAVGLPPRTIVFVHNAHRQLQSSEPESCASRVQAVANIRSQFKKNWRMLVLLAPEFTAPPELEHNVVIIDDALPGPEELRTMVKELYVSANASLEKAGRPTLGVPSAELLDRAVEALSGLSQFEAEQVTAMSLDENGLNIEMLWERKNVSIEQRRGMSVYRGKETFDDLCGQDSVKSKLRLRKKAKSPIGVVVWIDEGSDVFSNVDHDASGVKTDQQRALLVEMENNNWKGAIFTGVPGSGKSALARAFGNEAGVPTIALDFGDMESKYVGESESLLRQAIQTIKAVGQGNAFFILTCNSLQGIRPQFMRRFKKGVYFFDMPTPTERKAIWDFYIKKYEITKKQLPLPNDDAWTGAEIRECCEEAWDVNCTLREAAASIIPVARSRGDVIDKMRHDAHERFLDASKPGTYRYDETPMKEQKRAIELPPVSPAQLMTDLATLNKES